MPHAVLWRAASINPVFALPVLLATKGAALAGSIALGCGQFCSSPGVIVLINDPASHAFVAQLTTMRCCAPWAAA